MTDSGLVTRESPTITMVSNEQSTQWYEKSDFGRAGKCIGRCFTDYGKEFHRQPEKCGCYTGATLCFVLCVGIGTLAVYFKPYADTEDFTSNQWTMWSLVLACGVIGGGSFGAFLGHFISKKPKENGAYFRSSFSLVLVLVNFYLLVFIITAGVLQIRYLSYGTSPNSVTWPGDSMPPSTTFQYQQGPNAHATNMVTGQKKYMLTLFDLPRLVYQHKLPYGIETLSWTEASGPVNIHSVAGLKASSDSELTVYLSSDTSSGLAVKISSTSSTFAVRDPNGAFPNQFVDVTLTINEDSSITGRRLSVCYASQMGFPPCNQNFGGVTAH